MSKPKYNENHLFPSKDLFPFIHVYGLRFCLAPTTARGLSIRRLFSFLLFCLVQLVPNILESFGLVNKYSGFVLVYRLIGILVMCRMMDYIFNTTELDAMMKTWNASDIIFNFTSIQDPKLYFTIKPESGNNGACKLPSRLESVGAVAACQRDSRYFLKLAVELSFSYALYNLCFWYLLNHNFKDGKFVEIDYWPSSWKHILDAYMYCYVGFFNLYAAHCIGQHVVVTLLNCTYFPMMNQPFSSWSLIEFWSYRWDLLIKDNLYRVGFVPCINLLQKRMEVSPSIAKPIAALAAFFASAILHEVLLFVCNDFTFEGTFENTAFFMIHGLACIVETVVWGQQRPSIPVLGRKSGLNLVATHGVLLLTGPLFLNPYIRSGLFEKAMVLPRLFVA